MHELWRDQSPPPVSAGTRLVPLNDVQLPAMATW
jgi:hypothetical protein